MKSLHVVERTLPIAWEKAVIRTWYEGSVFRTEYDKEGDPESRDVSVMIHVLKPFSEPRIHRAFPGGLEDLEKYRSEVLYGVHDHWIDPEQGKWEYTYHERLFSYRLPDGKEIDQIEQALEKLREAGHTRRSQAVTWQAWQDPGCEDPSCLQRLWFRIENGKLNMNAHMRSNDAYKAAFMNMYAFTELQREVAAKLDMLPGEYIHIADSFHIYGSYFSEFEGFLKTANERAEDERVFTSEFARDFFVDGCKQLLAEPDMPEEKKNFVKRRLAELQ
jgi:thymidylate synthase